MSKDMLYDDFETHIKREQDRPNRGIEIQDPDTGYNLIKKSFNIWLSDLEGPKEVNKKGSLD